MNKTIEILAALFERLTGKSPEHIQALKAAGSPRKYYRISNGGDTVIGAFNKDVKENEAFFYFDKYYHHLGLNVPEMYIIHPDRKHYLLQDLGDRCLFDVLKQDQQQGQISSGTIDLYKQSLSSLIHFQLQGAKGLDFSYAYPHASFDRRSILWDLNYFKYYFLKMQDFPFDEGKLEDDFERLSEDVLKINSPYFMYRDFQARNIMIYQDKPAFIDFQGGRKGPLQYDVVSLLFQAKADLPFSLREELLHFYIRQIRNEITLNVAQFTDEYYKVLLIRLLQVLGAYGFRGLIQKRPHFMTSLAFGIKNIKWYVENQAYLSNFPELFSNLKRITDAEIKN
jgi:aminoglycoside/choline kinase family phosphotransferase